MHEDIQQPQSQRSLDNRNGDTSAPYEEPLSPLNRAETLPNEGDENRQSLADLTVADFLGLLLRQPLRTWRQFSRALGLSESESQTISEMPLVASVIAPSEPRQSAISWQSLRQSAMNLLQLKYAQLLFYALAIISALYGSVIARGTSEIPRADEYSLNIGAPFLWLGFLLWLAAGVVGNAKEIRDYWQQIDQLSRLRWLARIAPAVIWLNGIFMFAAAMAAPSETVIDMATTALSRFAIGIILWLVIEFVNWRLRKSGSFSLTLASQTERKPSPPRLISQREPMRRKVWREASPFRIGLILLAIISSIVIWTETSGNQVELSTIVLWLINAALWGFSFAPLGWSLLDSLTDRIDAYRRISWSGNRLAIIAFVLIMMIGASFRLDQLDTLPPQMNSDHVESIQAVYRIHYQNDYKIIFGYACPEPLQYYLMTILATQSGMAFDFYAMKLLSVLESLATLPLLFWLGVEIGGRKRRKWGIVLGLLLTGLVAISFWDVVLARTGYRLSLSLFFYVLIMIFFIRALRYNQRVDYIFAGLALGFGMYSFFSIRLLPIALVLGTMIALLVRRFSWRVRLNYCLNLLVLAFVAFVVFLPMLHFWVEDPNHFLCRATKLFYGSPVTSLEELAVFLNENIPTLLHNVRDTLLMFHYTSNQWYVTGVRGEPAMDSVTAAFMVLGVAAWLRLMVKSRDPVIFLVPFAILIMLIPSALSLSSPNEVPSNHRNSGAIPFAYLMAAFPVAVFCRHIYNSLPRRLGFWVAVSFAIITLLSAMQYNTRLYFGTFAERFAQSGYTRPYSHIGDIARGFVGSDGAYGNAIIVSYPHWLDHRAVGIEAGVMFWDNATGLSNIPQFIRRAMDRADFRLDPERDLLFFYHPGQEEALPQLQEWFPLGRVLTIELDSQGRTVSTYRVLALGAEGMQSFLQAHA